MELASGIVLSAEPTTWPALLTALASLSYPPSGNVPKSLSFPCCQRTACVSGKPAYRGSVSPFSDTPAISPFALIQRGELLPPPGSAPRSLKWPLLPAWKVCTTAQSYSEKQKLGANGSGIDVSA